MTAFEPFHTATVEECKAAIPPSPRTVEIYYAQTRYGLDVFDFRYSTIGKSFTAGNLGLVSGLGTAISEAEQSDLLQYLAVPEIPSEAVFVPWLAQFAGQGWEKITSLAALILAHEADKRAFLPGMNLTAWSWPFIDANFYFTLTPGKNWYLHDSATRMTTAHYTLTSDVSYEHNGEVVPTAYFSTPSVVDYDTPFAAIKNAGQPVPQWHQSTRDYLNDELEETRWVGIEPILPRDTVSEMFLKDSLALVQQAEHGTWPAK